MTKLAFADPGAPGLIAFSYPNRIWGLTMARAVQRTRDLDGLLERQPGPDFSAERSMAALYGTRIAGVDEAGRGPWAGPVVAAAVILDMEAIPPLGLNDSKQVAESQREALFDQITACALGYGIGIASHHEIDDINIRRATHLAMQRAVAALTLSGAPPVAVLVDGDDAPALDLPTRALVKGDGKAFSIAAASILAKVTRDQMMAALDLEHPGYGFARHKGYGTALHAQALIQLGPCPIHRTSFAPVAAARIAR